jgi:hypothetical protein
MADSTLKRKIRPNDLPKNTSVGVLSPRLFVGLLLSNLLTLFTDLPVTCSNRLFLGQN